MKNNLLCYKLTIDEMSIIKGGDGEDDDIVIDPSKNDTSSK